MILIFDNLEKALLNLDEALTAFSATAKTDPAHHLMRAAVIQYFEYSYELNWKLLKGCLEADLAKPNIFEMVENIKELYQKAQELSYIEDVGTWFTRFHKAGNNTAHNYAAEAAEQTAQLAQEFAAEVKLLLSKMKKRHG